MGKLHHPGCKIIHELEPLDGSEPEPCSAGAATAGGLVIASLLYAGNPTAAFDAVGALPMQRAVPFLEQALNLLR